MDYFYCLPLELVEEANGFIWQVPAVGDGGYTATSSTFVSENPMDGGACSYSPWGRIEPDMTDTA